MLSIKSWRLQPGVLIIGNLAEVRLAFDGDIYGADVGGVGCLGFGWLAKEI